METMNPETRHAQTIEPRNKYHRNLRNRKNRVGILIRYACDITYSDDR